MQLSSDRRFQFDVPPDRLWFALRRVPDYPDWWSWLDEFDGRRLRAGAVWHCAVQPPLPYTVRFRVILDEVDEARRVVAHLDGDLSGTASLEISPSGTGSEVRLRADLEPARRWLSVVGGVASPLVRWGHDWVLDTGARQFADHGTTGPDTAPVPIGARAALTAT